MKTFKQLNAKEKILYLGIILLYPLILLYEQLGKSVKFLNTRKRQITASVLTVCLILTMIPVMSLTIFAATGNTVTSGTFATTEDMWNGNITYNLIPDVTVPVTDEQGQLSTASGADIERWQAHWNDVMVPAGWGSDYITGEDDALQVYLPEGSEHYAIRPVQTGQTGDNANLGGAGANVEDNLGGVSYTIELCAADMAYANVGALNIYAYAEFFREKDQSYHHTLSFEFFDVNGNQLGSAVRYENTANNGAQNGYLNRTSDKYEVPAGTKYVRFWYCNVGSGDARKSVRNLQAYLTNSLVHTDHTNFIEWTATSGTIEESGNYYLSNDITDVTANINIGDGTTACEVNLCLNGHTLDLGDRYISVNKNAVLNICDCSATETGMMTSNGSYTVYINSGTVNFYKGTAENTVRSGITIYVDYGTANIVGGTVICIQSSARSIYNNYGTVNISGGTIKSINYRAVYNSCGSMFISGKPTISGENYDIYTSAKNAKLYATATKEPESAAYEGDTLSLDYSAEFGATVVYNAKSVERFIGGKSLSLDESGLNLVYALADAGYVTDEKQQMAYKSKGSSNYDIIGNSQSGWLKTTYSYGGYYVYHSNLNGATVVCTPKFVNGGRYVQLNYKVTASTTAVTNGKLNVNADTQIGSNDRATVEVIKDGDAVVGLKMADTNSNNPSYGAQFNLYFRGPGTTKADTYWFGYYYERTDNYYNQLSEENKSSNGTYAEDLSSYSNYDSGFSISWQNISLAAGESKTFSLLVGVGDSVEAPVLTLTPDSATDKVHYTATVTDSVDTVVELFYNVNGGEGISLGTKTIDSTGSVVFSDTIDFTSLSSTTHTLTFWAVNDAGAMSGSKTCTVTVIHRHAWERDWTVNNTHHWHECSVDYCDVTKTSQKPGYGEHISTGKNVATYFKKPVCDICNAEYGAKLVDSIAPTGEIKIGENGWIKFWNTVTFGLFFKDYVEIEITGADAETNVKSIEYYISNTAISNTDIANITQWEAYTGKVKIDAERKVFVYAKITDNAGNTAYISVNGGIVVYKDTEAGTTQTRYVITSNRTVEVDVLLNGNTIKSVKNGNYTLVEGKDYTVGQDKIILNSSYLETLSVQTYDFTVQYNPLGESYVGGGNNEAPNSTQFSLRVAKRRLALPQDDRIFTYNGKEQTYEIEESKFYTFTGNKQTDAGKYIITVAIKDEYKDKVIWENETTKDLKLEFNIGKANFTANVKQHGDLTYNGGNQSAFVDTDENNVIGGQSVTYKYGTSENACDSKTVPVFKAAGTYTVYYVASAPNHNDYKGSFQIIISPKTLTIDDFGYIGGTLFKVYDGTTAASVSRPIIITAVKGLQGADTSPAITVLSAVFDSANAGDRILNVSVEGNSEGNYVWNAGIVKVDAEIMVKAISNPQIVLSQNTFIYSGNENKPDVKVYDGDIEIPASEYTVDYIDNINAGIATVAITDKYGRNYAVEGSEIFVIGKADPETNFPTDLSIAVGKKLSDITLPEGYTWNNPDTVVAYGINKYDMTYIVPGPYGATNYNPVSQKVEVKGLDVTAPTGEITLKENKWNEFLNDITFGLFFKETQSITITAADTESGVKEIAYYLSTEELSVEDVKALENGKWTVYTDAFNVEPDNKYVVYARITDNAGNVIYINSDGIVLDSIKPVIAGVEDGKDVYGDATFTVDEDYLDTVTLDGEPIDAPNGKYSVPADNKEHTIVVTDKTGNQVTYKLTVYKNYKVSFIVDGKEIRSSEIGYGKDAELPEIPQKAGYTAKWDVNGKNITADTVITAVYEKIPQTGDSLNSWLWASLMLLSGLSIFGIMITKKRKKEAE